MEIKRTLTVMKVTRSAPNETVLQVVFLDDPHESHSREHETSSLILDKHTARRYGIPYSLDAWGKKIACTLTSHPHPLTEQIEDNILILASFHEEKRVFQHCTTFSCPPFQKETEECCTLKLVTPSKSGLQHRFHPCPFYELIFEITKNECKEYKELRENSVFLIDLTLAS